MNKCLLGDVAKSQTGPFGSQLHEADYVEQGTPIVTVEHLGDIGFTTQNLPFVSRKDTERLSKFLLEEGDIVFSRVGSIDRSVYVKKEQEGWMFSGRCLRVRCDKTKINPRYLSYYFKLEDFKKMMLNISVGATMPSLNTKLMDSIPLNVLTRGIQDKIAGLLDSIDLKIENNNKISAELESMAKTIYNYWFLQFEFPNKDGKPYKSSGGKMVWNEELKREIPEGWIVNDLSDIASITMGTSPKGDSINTNDEGIVFYQGKADFGNRFPIIRTYTNSPIRYAEENDILLSVRAPVGTLNIANQKCCIGRGLAAIHSEYTSFIYYLMLANQYKFDTYNNGGTTFGAITKDDLFKLRLLIPEKNVIKKFEKEVNSVDQKINKGNAENQNLISLRDFLLPLLMNGQVGFKD